MEGVSKEVIDEMARESEGFSGRELHKMVVAWHDAAFTLPTAVLTPDLMRKILHKFHLQHKLKQTWTKEESMLFEKMLFLDESVHKGSLSADHDKKDEEMLRD